MNDQQKFLIEQQQKASDSAVKDANEAGMEIVKQLIFTGTVLLTASFFIFNLSNLKTELSSSFKLIYLISWITILSSIVLGISQLWVDYKFNIKWAVTIQRIIKRIGDGEAKDEVDLKRILSEQDDLPQISSNEFMHFQIVALIIGIASLFTVISKLLGIWT